MASRTPNRHGHPVHHGMTSDTYSEWNAALAQARLGVAPAELHGSVTGFLCAGWAGHAHELLASLALESEADEPVDSDALHALLERAVANIGARLRTGKPVELLLPGAPLAARADAAVDWCRGFLGGLGLTGVLEDGANGPAIRELLRDFGHIAASHLAVDEDDEAALDEVLAFIREGVAHLHATFAPTGRA
ncbi:MAG: hypothetical protein EPN36_04630 [Rhodanobacteraceae bacterium]|nr:MAG: hypothetical protein EPN36_04630 [Rhodanobacteraceae bacterium]